jgi:hypothetical protein
VPRFFSVRYLAVLGVVTYLCAAGWFLVLAPWSRVWLALVVAQAPWPIMGVLENAAVRGALSGFGVIHFGVAYAWLHAATVEP